MQYRTSPTDAIHRSLRTDRSKTDLLPTTLSLHLLKTYGVLHGSHTQRFWVFAFLYVYWKMSTLSYRLYGNTSHTDERIWGVRVSESFGTNRLIILMQWHNRVLGKNYLSSKINIITLAENNSLLDVSLSHASPHRPILKKEFHCIRDTTHWKKLSKH